MKILRDESGQTLVFVALALTCILGFMGLATDVGTLLHAKRNLQIVADSAAVAGAWQLKLNPANVTSAATAAANSNGVSSGVIVNNPPATGPHAGNAAYVEVIIPQSEPLFFARALGLTTMNVAARAVAFAGAINNNSCVLATNPTAPDTIHLQGSFNVDVPGCQVIDDSNNSNALTFTGAGGTLAAGYVGVVGGATGATGDSTPAPVQHIAPVSDPLGNLPAPTYDPASCTAVPNGTTWGPAAAGGTVCYSGNIKTMKNITMNPGVYVFPGTLDFTGTRQSHWYGCNAVHPSRRLAWRQR